MKKYIGILLLSLATLSCNNERNNSPMKNKKMNRFIDSLMSQMTLKEKLGQLNLSGGIGETTTEKSIIEYIGEGLIGSARGRKEQEAAVNQSRLGIPLISGLDIIHGYQTTFPIPLAMSCMWDLALIEEQARIAAEEATTEGINWTWSPMVDICRDARWGRIAEGAGEDPWYSGLVAQAYIRGYQGDDMSKPNTLMACVKHVALYGASEAGRDYNTVDMSRITMFQDYLPPYKAAFDANVGSAMTSFNVVDAVPATGNQWLMNDLLRKQWGFDGLVVTDYTAIMEMIHHGLAGNLQEASIMALKSNVDMDMMSQGFISTLPQSLKEKKITIEEIDRACRRVLEAKYKLGLFDNPFQYFDKEKAKRIILSKEHLAVARDIAARSVVLLKNENKTLPLSKKGKIAVVGPLAHSRIDMLGTWAATSDTTKVVSILEGIQTIAGKKAKVMYAKGAYATIDTFLLNRNNSQKQPIVHSSVTAKRMLTQAKSIAQKADVIIAVLGEPRAWSGEAASRSDIGIPHSQKKLLKSMLATGKPVVLVLANGRPMTIQWETENVPAILEAWHGGTMAGMGVADVLFGDYNPSGKLTTTFPFSVGQIPIYYNHKNTGRPYVHKQKFTGKYLDIPNEPLFPFGYGLSYTTFEYSDISLNKKELKGDESLIASVTIKNTGEYDGEEVVQLYINDPVASVSRPLKELKGFKKIKINAGDSKKVEFKITPKHLKFFSSNLRYDWEEGEFNIYIGTNSQEVRQTSIIWKK